MPHDYGNLHDWISFKVILRNHIIVQRHEEQPVEVDAAHGLSSHFATHRNVDAKWLATQWNVVTQKEKMEKVNIHHYLGE